MNRRRWLYLFSFLFVVATVSIAAAIDTWWKRLPPPSQSNSAQLFQWLVSRDVAIEPGTTREALVARMLSELDSGIDFPMVDNRLENVCRERFHRNVDVLLQTWLHMLAEEFAALPAARRDERVDATIDRVANWGVLEYLAARSALVDASDQRSRWEVVHAFDKRAASWIRQAEPARRARMQHYINALHRRILFKAFAELKTR